MDACSLNVAAGVGQPQEEGSRHRGAGGGSGAEASGREQNVEPETPRLPPGPGRELVPGRPDALTSSLAPGDDEPVAIPLSKNAFLRSKITALPSKIYFNLNSAVGLLPGLDLTEMKGDEQRNRGAGGSPGG
ncbi:MAG TPA: hypothetical protein VJX94_08715 [Stellaceae bacterium]|nr:hypothetical protein [Stellaceae bacterium]